ncbi:MAG: hypothetical protein AAB937_01020 [Patescibacteria group bacterium]
MKKKLISRKLSRDALRLAEGVFAHAVDLSLWVMVYFDHMSVPQSRGGLAWRARIAADNFLCDVNYDVIKNALQTARKRGWVTNVKRNANPEITAEGRRRLQEIVPHYDSVRVWDARMHIVTYDIPEKHKHDREVLRRFLRTIRCARLQDSVWITPYNPVTLVRTCIQNKGLHGTIIVSDMGKDGSLGDEKLINMLVRVYDLEVLNDRYRIWLEHVEDIDQIDHASLLSYLSILDDDPQLPFSLLPSWWKGDKAYKIAKLEFENIVNKYAIA